MASKLIQGKDVILSIYDETNEAYKPVACLTDNGYSVSVETTEGDANKCDPTPPQEIGSATYEVTGDGQMLDPSDDNYLDRTNSEVLNELVWAKEPVTWRLDGGYDTKYGEGVITSYNEDYPAEGTATFSLTITGQGEVTEDDPKSEVTEDDPKSGD